MSMNEPPPPPPPPGPPPPPAYPGGNLPGGMPAPAPQNKKAVWALVLGIVSLLCCGVIGIFAAIPAIILGSQARKEIAASGGLQSGAGMAQAGLILGIIGVVLGLLVCVLTVALFMSGAFEGGTFQPPVAPPTP